MLCLRKVSVRHISTVHLYPSQRTVRFHEVAGHSLLQQMSWQTNMATAYTGAGVSRSKEPVWPLVCDLCSPVPSILWRRADGNPLPGKIKINHSSGVLEIPYFRPEDAGVYECVAENSRGRNVARGQLIFHSKNHVSSLLFWIFCSLISTIWYPTFHYIYCVCWKKYSIKCFIICPI